MCRAGHDQDRHRGAHTSHTIANTRANATTRRRRRFGALAADDDDGAVAEEEEEEEEDEVVVVDRGMEEYTCYPCRRGV